MDTQVKMLPSEIQNKIFYMCAEHPVAKIFKESITFKEVIGGRWISGHIAFFWSDTGEWFHNAYINEDKVISGMMENNVKIKNIGK